MIRVRKSADRGRASLGWLESRHTFSFGEYHDPQHMGFRALRVINEDRVRPGQGFGTHGHTDMEILSYVLSGKLAHEDSLGNGSVLAAGDFQRMTAGTGVRHSERNPSRDEPVHFLQVWILPEREGLEPGYEESNVPVENKRGTLCLVASRRGGSGALEIHQDVDLYSSVLAPDRTVALDLRPGRHAWVQVVRGAVRLNSHDLAEGDGAAVSDERAVTVTGRSDAEILLFDLA